MSESLYFLALLACPLGMGMMMWMMMKMQRPSAPASTDSSVGATVDKQAELIRMRAEIDQLRAERADHRGDAKPAGWAL